MNKAVIILGYNNTRIGDVKKIREKIKVSVDALTVLCKKDPTEMDHQAVDYVINVDLTPSDENINHIISCCDEQNLKIIGVLPFSDQGTQLGASLAKHLGLPGANPDKIEAALNKHTFRKNEKNNQAPEGYFAVNAVKVTTLEALKDAFKKSNSGIFLKPMAEGNSRGCIAIKDINECETAWNEVKQYLSGGITAENLIENAQEYSWEHVSGYSWVTEKKTTQSQYRAEPQHILPAPISNEAELLLTNGTRYMAEICGYDGCACHNEIFLLNGKKGVMAVEPNLRPAGGKLWDLSMHAFENFDPWTSWILWATGKVDHKPKALKQISFAGMRFISARKTGTLKEISITRLDQLSEKLNANYIELVWTKKMNDSVTADLRDNADFLGYITAKADDYATLEKVLVKAEALLAESCFIN